ncbi:peptidoglycan DD-metalloendopeptidase family protein [Photobacterium atrarenae]|uniref:Peptidoglycan DD-metalloendopeptidase family protein n=1 Tax=Photobacterium atrarenae TaxID=865757 RepID=A0ABY5GGS4_9GAMM|nr:peptidoglycan DD-metalloendopeptidase family protein [Photobacterium atrarenae]UTV27909.1 peptidoglycan DD-metalloendopeptidase family protein [Photobacterium atrarenae]
MRDQIKRLTQLLRASAFSTGALLCLTFTPPALSASQQQLDGVKQEISRQQNQLSSKQKKINTLQQSLKQQELAIAATAKKIHQAEATVRTLARSIQALQQEQQALLQQQLGQQEMLKELLNTHYRQGKSSQLATLLSGMDQDRLDRMTVYAERLSQARAHTLDDLAATKTELQLKTHQLSQQRQQQQDLLAQLTDEKRRLEREQQQRQKTVRTIKGQLKSDTRYLSELKNNEKRLVAEIAKAKAAAEAARRVAMNGLAGQKGKLPWPVKGTIRHRYGSPLQGELRWKGMVISKPKGSQVNAIYGGKVVFADWLRGYGLMVAIDHGKGYMSFYGYNQTLLKKVGDTVQPSEAIALVGDSGGQETSALYFEIRRKGTALDPQSWLTR